MRLPSPHGNLQHPRPRIRSVYKEELTAMNMNQPLQHLPYCAKSGVHCAVYHADGICPHVRDCPACKAEAAPQSLKDSPHSQR